MAWFEFYRENVKYSFLFQFYLALASLKRAMLFGMGLLIIILVFGSIFGIPFWLSRHALIPLDIGDFLNLSGIVTGLVLLLVIVMALTLVVKIGFNLLKALLHGLGSIVYTGYVTLFSILRTFKELPDEIKRSEIEKDYL